MSKIRYLRSHRNLNAHNLTKLLFETLQSIHPYVFNSLSSPRLSADRQNPPAIPPMSSFNSTRVMTRQNEKRVNRMLESVPRFDYKKIAFEDYAETVQAAVKCIPPSCEPLFVAGLRFKMTDGARYYVEEADSVAEILKQLRKRYGKTYYELQYELRHVRKGDRECMLTYVERVERLHHHLVACAKEEFGPFCGKKVLSNIMRLACKAFKLGLPSHIARDLPSDPYMKLHELCDEAIQNDHEFTSVTYPYEAYCVSAFAVRPSSPYDRDRRCIEWSSDRGSS